MGIDGIRAGTVPVPNAEWQAFKCACDSESGHHSFSALSEGGMASTLLPGSEPRAVRRLPRRHVSGRADRRGVTRELLKSLAPHGGGCAFRCSGRARLWGLVPGPSLPS